MVSHRCLSVGPLDALCIRILVDGKDLAGGPSGSQIQIDLSHEIGVMFHRTEIHFSIRPKSPLNSVRYSGRTSTTISPRE